MKLASFETGDGERVGLVLAERILDLSRAMPAAPREMNELIREWPRWAPELERLSRQAAPHFALSDVHLLAPVPRPQKILAIGLNYDDHIAESGRVKPQTQTWFSKMPSAVNGPYDPIQIPRASAQVDYEAELVFIIGQRCRHVRKEAAASVVFGYCAGNDVSVRDWQFATTQFVLGKSFDTHAPFGPWIVTPDELGDPHALGIRCFVNGETRQESNTRHLIFNVFDQIAWLSQALTLEPGDVIYTGTPAGVGFAMNPPKFLQAGDVVRVEIDRLGALENRVAPEL
jgi:2-keto-4-pentenoate hydratase/2-oxohepta-3-ene-1,7-dioic acid hydratase in catechol pathway